MTQVRKLLEETLRVWQGADVRSAARWTAALVRLAPAVLRTRTLVRADRAVTGTACFAFADGSQVSLEDAFGAGREMYCRGVYEPNKSFSPRQGWTVVDLGANQGLFSTMAAVRGARIALAVEAQGRFGPLIRANAERNGVAERVVAVPALVGSSSGVFTRPERREAASHWDVDPECAALVELLDRYGLAHVDMLKVDIEGSEFALFDEAEEWLPRVDRIAMEVHSEFGSGRELRDRVRAEGFSAWLTDDRLREVGEITAPSGYLYAVRDDRAVS